MRAHEDSESSIIAGQRVTIFGGREKGWGIIINGEVFRVPQGAFEEIYRAAEYKVAVEVARQLAEQEQELR